MAAGWFDELVAPGRQLDSIGGSVLSALAPDRRGAPYDTRAAVYDRVVGNLLYNRLLWGASTSSYGAFAVASLTDGEGPLLDVGYGSFVLTATAYRNSSRPLVLVDRSLAMLSRAEHRLRGHDPDRVAFAQADLFDLPFRPGCFATVACHGLLHLFDDLDAVLGALRAQAAVGGSLYATSLAAETRRSRWALRQMARTGEAAAPRRQDELAAGVRAALGVAPEVHRQGAMVFVTAGPLR